MNFTDSLIKKKIITQDELESAFSEAEKNGLAIEDALVMKGIKEEDITMAKADSFGVPVKNIGGRETPFSILKLIPEESARHFKFVPVGFKDEILEVGMVDPDDINAREALQFITSKLEIPFKIFLISKSDFNKVLESYKGIGGEISKAMGDLESALSDVDIVKTSVKSGTLEKKIVEDAPVTKMVAVILRHATEGNASDIHIEPIRNALKVRFREDGVLYTSLMLPLNVHEAIVARIKILANLKIDEKRKPQDGRFSAHIEDREVDFRISTFPTFSGEKVVLRILDSEKGVKSLDEFDIPPDKLEIIKKGLKKPYGLILLTGPTGSGKTTTLYSMLKEIDREKSNVVSLEDPIEYSVTGVNQSQVRPEIGYDFASGLRSVLRQDPDVIMVGEIRDKETAELAIQAALTGHLVFSTLHTNSAVGVVTRLIDMGIDPFLIAPTLILSINQRLVQKLCNDSKKEILVNDSIKIKIKKELSEIDSDVKKNINLPDKIYQAMPSAVCPRGTKGRIAVFEILENTKDIEKLILDNSGELEILKTARQQGMLTLRESALIKVLEGKIGFEEMYKL